MAKRKTVKKETVKKPVIKEVVNPQKMLFELQQLNRDSLIQRIRIAEKW